MLSCQKTWDLIYIHNETFAQYLIRNVIRNFQVKPTQLFFMREYYHLSLHLSHNSHSLLSLRIHSLNLWEYQFFEVILGTQIGAKLSSLLYYRSHSFPLRQIYSLLLYLTLIFLFLPSISLIFAIKAFMNWCTRKTEKNCRDISCGTHIFQMIVRRCLCKKFWCQVWVYVIHTNFVMFHINIINISLNNSFLCKF